MGERWSRDRRRTSRLRENCWASLGRRLWRPRRCLDRQSGAFRSSRGLGPALASHGSLVTIAARLRWLCAPEVPEGRRVGRLVERVQAASRTLTTTVVTRDARGVSQRDVDLCGKEGLLNRSGRVTWEGPWTPAVGRPSSHVGGGRWGLLTERAAPGPAPGSGQHVLRQANGFGIAGLGHGGGERHPPCGAGRR
jgi:hypothetical protein